MADEFEPRSENLVKSTKVKDEYQFCDLHSNPIHTSLEVFKKTKKIVAYPFTYSETFGLRIPRIRKIELRGWENLEDVPDVLKKKGSIRIHGPATAIFSYIRYHMPKVEKLSVVANGNNRFLEKSITLNIETYKALVRSVKREQNNHKERRKVIVSSELAELTDKIKKHKMKLTRGGVSSFIALFSELGQLSEEDVSGLLQLIGDASFGNVSIRDNFIQTKDKVNVAYLEDVIEEFDKLLASTSKNEKEWQEFFEKNCWTLSHLFPYEVLLYKREALVGGKTIENTEGRLVDFLFANGFSDNYALIETKTHNSSLLKATAYRDPAAFAMHDDLSGGISQCLDQRNQFTITWGNQYKIRDPRSVLIVGLKSKLNENQAACFELIRNNQQSVDIVTFDELRAKLVGLLGVLKS